MILGIGTDLVQVARMQGMWERHGRRLAERILHPVERSDLPPEHPAGFLARRFAAKEALAKALGCGVGADMGLAEAGVTHDARGARNSCWRVARGRPLNASGWSSSI